MPLDAPLSGGQLSAIDRIGRAPVSERKGYNAAGCNTGMAATATNPPAQERMGVMVPVVFAAAVAEALPVGGTALSVRREWGLAGVWRHVAH